jgi:hypothetical protein
MNREGFSIDWGERGGQSSPLVLHPPGFGSTGVLPAGGRTRPKPWFMERATRLLAQRSGAIDELAFGNASLGIDTVEQKAQMFRGHGGALTVKQRSCQPGSR